MQLPDKKVAANSGFYFNKYEKLIEKIEISKRKINHLLLLV